MQMNNFYKVLLLLISGILTGCNPSQPSAPFEYDQAGSILAIALKENSIQKANLRFDSVHSRQSFYEIPAHGIVSKDNHLVIAAPFDGKISFKYIAEHSIGKGQAVATIQNIELITLQQEFLEAKNQFDYYKEEYTRQGELTVENATSIKKMQGAKRDYQSAELRYHALALKLKILGINSEELSVNSLIPYVTVMSPIQGSSLKFTVSEYAYVHAGDPIAEISSSCAPYIECSVPEIYYQKIKTGDDVDCMIASDTLNILQGKVVKILKEINPDSKEGIIHVKVSDTPELIQGMGVKCSIRTSEESGMWVQSSALLKEHNTSFVFLKHEGLLLKVPVKTGSKNNAETEITGLPAISMDSLVISGFKRLAPLFKLQ